MDTRKRFAVIFLICLFASPVVAESIREVNPHAEVSTTSPAAMIATGTGMDPLCDTWTKETTCPICGKTMLREYDCGYSFLSVEGSSLCLVTSPRLGKDLKWSNSLLVCPECHDELQPIIDDNFNRLWEQIVGNFKEQKQTERKRSLQKNRKQEVEKLKEQIQDLERKINRLTD